MKIKNILLIVSLLSFGAFYGQLSKGDDFYKKGQYIYAAPCYKKVAKSITASKKDKLEGYIKLGNCYKKMNDYAKAEDAYQEASNIKAKAPAGAEYLYNYAQILKTNGKYPQAIEQYNNYLKLNPNDLGAKNSLKFCEDIKSQLAKPIEYMVKNVESINTRQAEYAPYVLNSKLLFVAQKETFNFVEFTTNTYNGAPYSRMYVSKINGEKVSKTRKFAKNLSGDYYNGPACASGDGKTLYFSRVGYKDGSGLVNQAQIYSASAIGIDEWDEGKIVNIGSDDYSVSHPSISEDNNTLYFTSDMPGGFGGKDIYVSRRSGTTWTKPANLGPSINTSGDEMYPSIRKDGVLFFSSSGLPGYGGLDIFSAQKTDNKWAVIRNEGPNINSTADDFGITFLADSVGYFSSNREGGKGDDDIYQFTFKSKATSVLGTILLTENINNPCKRIKVYLKDVAGKVLDSMMTDEKGFFEFKNINSDLQYMASLDENDPALNGKARFYLAGKDGVIHRVTNKIGNDKFVFKNLPIDFNGLPDLYTDDDLSIGGNLLHGSENNPIKNSRIKLINDFGDVIEEARTNEFGAFVFRKIPGDQNYLLSIEESDINLPEGTRVVLTNKKGKELKTFLVGKDKFTFKILNAEKNLLEDMMVEDAELLMNLNGYVYDENKKVIGNVKLVVKEENGANPYYVTSNEKGKFSFKNLYANKSYLFETEENDPALSGKKRIYIADASGKVFRMIDLINGKFSFKIIDADKQALADLIVDDPWLQALHLKSKKGDAQLTIIESILYASGDYKPDAAGQKILNKVSAVLASNQKLVIEIISHTDSKASDAFNLNLSKQRAQTAVDYIVAKGIDLKRLKAIGLGETKLLNRCTNGVNCSDDEHKVNRRTEFKISELQKM